MGAESYAVGDKVRVIANGAHGFPDGAIGTVRETGSMGVPDWCEVSVEGIGFWQTLAADEMEPVE